MDSLRVFISTNTDKVPTFSTIDANGNVSPILTKTSKFITE